MALAISSVVPKDDQVVDPNVKVEQWTAYVALYRVTRAYGGPEEGGWWYDAYEWMGVAIPFMGVVTFHKTLVDGEDDAPECNIRYGQDDNFPYGTWNEPDEDPEMRDRGYELTYYWAPVEIKPNDELLGGTKETAWVEAAKDKLKELYDTDEYAVVIEYHPGRRGMFRRPRYC